MKSATAATDLKLGVAIVSCNDGLRPVIMKLEATEKESKVDYEPGADRPGTERVFAGG